MTKYSRSTINAQQLAFVDELLLDPGRVAWKAYERVYKCGKKAAHNGAYHLLRHPPVIQEIAERDIATIERNQLSIDRLTQHLVDLVEADPRDLTEYRRGACRYCHGENHRYHFTPGELERAIEQYKRENEAAQRGKPPHPPHDPMAMFFDYKGGVGFTPNAAPHPNCPECFGHGEGYEFFNDTRDLSAQAARLFSGVARTKEGMKVTTRSQDKALELALRVAGLLSEKPKDDDAGEPPTTTVTYTMEDASRPEDDHLRPGGGPKR